jgi:membrane protein implicated in regulation of membrane protease activity
MRGLPASQGRAAAAPRAAAVAILLAVTAAGLQARGTFSHAPDATAAGASGAVLAIILTAAEGVALVAFVLMLASIRPSHPNKPDDPDLVMLRIPWWVKTLGVLLALAALVTPLAVLLTRKPRKTQPRPLPSIAGPGTATGHLKAAGAGAIWPVIAGMAVAIAIVLALTAWSRHQRRDARRRPRQRNRLTQLLDSLAAAQDALTKAGGEPREAIIACYAAMERGFAAAGRQTAPAAADTPAEVLTRATQAGLVSAEPAAALTGLFRRARYSSQPMTKQDSEAASGALDRMRADLDTIPAGPP